MRIAILCYPTYGGSGVVATELGIALARRGHHVHFISYEQPFRLNAASVDIRFHSVDVPSYPLFKYPPYMIALASKIYEVHGRDGLDVIHAHYALPHAVAGYLAREMVGDGTALVTTLHGTDITLLGVEPGFAPAVEFSINKSDAVTAVSRHLAAETMDRFDISRKIDVIPNFIDPSNQLCRPDPELRARFALPTEPIVIHVSNFRPVKQPGLVVETFATACREIPGRLLLVGDGPELCSAFARARELGVADQVTALGNQDDVISLLSIADVFLLPSRSESFGLAALEAMACELPVVATDVGGLPEVVVDGVTGYLCPVDQPEVLAARLIELVRDRDLCRRMGRAGRRRAVDVFSQKESVDAYEQVYHRALSACRGHDRAWLSQEPG